MNHYASLCDDFYVNMNLGTEMELPANRETVLHFFERMQKTYPTMRNFYCRERGDFILEEDKDQGAYRWCTIEPRRVCSGQVNPETIDGAMEQHKLVLELAPYMLSVSPLDCEALDLLFGFDFTYRGNHNQLMAEVLGVGPSMEPALGGARRDGDQLRAVGHDRRRSRLPPATSHQRGNADQRLSGPHGRVSRGTTERLRHRPAIRQLSTPTRRSSRRVDRLRQLCHETIDNHVIEHILQPLGRAISMR